MVEETLTAVTRKGKRGLETKSPIGNARIDVSQEGLFDNRLRATM